MLANSDFAMEFEPAQYVELDAKGGRRQSDFMSGNFAWCQCVCLFLLVFVFCKVRLTLGLSGLLKDVIYEEDLVNNDGCMFVPIVLGSDKTTVSVGTGDIEYHPLYFSRSLPQQRQASTLERPYSNQFLTIPKSKSLVSYIYRSNLVCR